MENEKTYVPDKVVDELMERKFDKYCSGTKDFVIPHELTVTITLKEYRDLITNKANSENKVYEIALEKRKLEEELEAYKKENELLTRKIMRMESPASQVDDKAEEA